MSLLPAGVTVAEATDFLRQLRINSAPAVNGEGRLIGIVSEKDFICVLPHRNSWSLPVEQIMHARLFHSRRTRRWMQFAIFSGACPYAECSWYAAACRWVW